MQQAILDTSVVVKWFAEEEDSNKAAELLEAVIGARLEVIAPELILAEAANALRYNKNFKQNETEKIIAELIQLNLSLFPLQDIILPSIETAYNFDLAIYDAVFIALADKLGVDLITADYQHHRKKYSKYMVWLKELDTSKFIGFGNP